MGAATKTILGEKASDADWAVMEKAIRNQFPNNAQKVKEILGDGVLTYGEIVDTFIFDCQNDGVSDQKDNLAQCTQASPILGRAIDVLKKYGMLLEQEDAVLLDDGATQSTENGDLHEATVYLRQAFALSDDIAFKQSVLKRVGALYVLQTQDPDISDDETSRLLLSAQRATEDAINLDPQSNGDVVFAAHFNLGQIYFSQYQMLREKDPDKASQVLAKAVEQFQKVVDHDPSDADAKARLEACEASVRGRGLVEKVHALLGLTEKVKGLMGKQATEADKSRAIVQFIASEKGDVAQNVNDFLQAAINYKLDAGDDEFKTPAKLVEDGRGDCDDWVVFAHEVFKEAGIDHYMIRLPNLENFDNNVIEHVATLYRDRSGSFFVIDQEGITALDTKDPKAALQKYASYWQLGGEPYDWTQIKVLKYVEGEKDPHEIPVDDLNKGISGK